MYIHDLFESSVPSTDYGYWISPTGEIISVQFCEHEVVMNGLGMTNDEALIKGWIRVIAYTRNSRSVFVTELGLGTAASPAIRAWTHVLRAYPEQDTYEVEVMSDDSLPTEIDAWKKFENTMGVAAYVRKVATIETIAESAVSEIPPTRYGYWINAEGEFIVVPYQQHDRVLTKMGVARKDANDNGWVQVGSNVKEAPNQLFVRFREHALSARAMSAIRRLARSQEFSKFYMTATSPDFGIPDIETNTERMGPFLNDVLEYGRPVRQELDEAAIPATNYGYWISPEGEYYPVKFQDHAATIRKLLNQTTYSALDAGWVRVIDSNGEFQVELDAHTGKTRALSAIRRLVTSGSHYKLHASVHRSRDNEIGFGKTFARPGMFLQYLSMVFRPAQQLDEAAIPASDYGYWIDSEGAVHSVSWNGSAGHLGFIRQLNDPEITGYSSAFEHGWIRVVNKPDNAGRGRFFYVQAQSGTYGARQLSALRRVIDGCEADSYYFDMIGSTEDTKSFNAPRALLSYGQEHRRPFKTTEITS